jgi:rod shape-determining protein MreB
MKFWPVSRFFSFFSNDLAIDLGTANTVIYVRNQGIILDQPSVVAVKYSTNEVLAAGDKAKCMLGKTPESITACRPMRDGVIANFELTESMLRYFIREVHNNRKTLVRPRMIIGVPSGITQVERRAVEDSAKQAGAREVYTIMEPMAAAIGAGLPVEDPAGNMIVDIGGGTTEVAIISLKDVVYCKSVRVGGDEMDRSIVQYVKRKYNLLIGERTAEVIKVNIGTALLGDETKKFDVKGRDLITGVPKTITLTDAEVLEALTEPISVILDAVRSALENAPPELSSDLVDRGIVMAGGGSLLRNLDVLISKETGLPVRVSENPLLSVVLGAGKVIDELDFFRDALLK